MDLEFLVDDLDVLDKALRKFDKKTRSKIMTTALKGGAKEILEKAKDDVDISSGTLKKSLGVAIRKSRNTFEKNVVVIARKGKELKNDGFYAHMEEFGTSHSPAHPFLGPAAKDKAGEAISKTGTMLASLMIEVT